MARRYPVPVVPSRYAVRRATPACALVDSVATPRSRWTRAVASARRDLAALRAVSGGDESAADGVSGELDAVAHPEFLEHVGAVAVDGLAADDEQLGDLVAGVPFGDELEDLELARGQRVDILAAAGALEVVAHERRDRAGVEEG